MSVEAEEPSAPSSDTDCPYWRRGYCVADKSCKMVHDTTQGGQLQESYLAQVRQKEQISGSNTAQTSTPSQHSAHLPRYAPYGSAMPSSAMASAVYGGGQPVMYGYGYYGQPAMMMIPATGTMIGAPSQPMTGPPRNYKTLPCRHFHKGHCMRGSACGFRHGEEDACSPAPGTFGQLPEELSHPLHPGRPFRVVTCRRWAQGHCSMGERCTFRHDFESQENSYYQGPPVSSAKRSLSPDKPRDGTADAERLEKVQKVVKE